MFSKRKPSMSMNLVSQMQLRDQEEKRRRKLAEGPSHNTAAATRSYPVLVVEKQPSLSQPMFSYNMNHLRNARPCGSCGGK